MHENTIKEHEEKLTCSAEVGLPETEFSLVLLIPNPAHTSSLLSRMDNIIIFVALLKVYSLFYTQLFFVCFFAFVQFWRPLFRCLN
jgi:hypothetical protein